MKKLGLLTYDAPHDKSERILLGLLKYIDPESICVILLPFSLRNSIATGLRHRPHQFSGEHMRDVAARESVEVIGWDLSSYLEPVADCYLVGGAGIIDVRRLGDVPVLNVHPGLIPVCKGLDALKWAVYFGLPVANTVHVISNEVDMGSIVKVSHTAVLVDDSFDDFAARHYQREIQAMVDVARNPLDLENQLAPFDFGCSVMNRMPLELDNELLHRFEIWKQCFTTER